MQFWFAVEKAEPKEQAIHIVPDIYATYKHAQVLDWIERQ